MYAGIYHPYICHDDSDYSRCMTFMLETRRTADPGLRTAEAYAAMLRVLTYGEMLRIEDDRGDIVAIAGYTRGTPQDEYEDHRIVYVEYCLASASLHGTFFFLWGLNTLVRTIRERHPEAVWMSLMAAENHRLNNRLYRKFARQTGVIEYPEMNMNLYFATLEEVSQYVGKFC